MSKPVTEQPPIRVWRMNDCDWVVARTKTQAVDYYLQFTGASRTEILADDPRPLTKRELELLTFFTEEYEEGDDGALKRHSFATELRLVIERGEPVPTFFASTEF